MIVLRRVYGLYTFNRQVVFGSGVSSDGMLNIDPWVKFRPICSCVFHHMFRCRGWRTLPMPPSPPGRSVPRQSYDAQWVSSAQRGTLYPYASERACIPHIPKTALLFAGCHLLSVIFLNFKLKYVFKCTHYNEYSNCACLTKMFIVLKIIILTFHSNYNISFL